MVGIYIGTHLLWCVCVCVCCVCDTCIYKFTCTHVHTVYIHFSYRLLSQKSKSHSDTDSTLVSGALCTLNPTGLQGKSHPTPRPLTELLNLPGPPGNTTGEVSREERVITFQDFQVCEREGGGGGGGGGES